MLAYRKRGPFRDDFAEVRASQDQSLAAKSCSLHRPRVDWPSPERGRRGRAKHQKMRWWVECPVHRCAIAASHASSESKVSRRVVSSATHAFISSLVSVYWHVLHVQSDGSRPSPRGRTTPRGTRSAEGAKCAAGIWEYLARLAGAFKPVGAVLKTSLPLLHRSVKIVAVVYRNRLPSIFMGRVATTESQCPSRA